MPLVFVDAHGTEGRIADDFSVDYDGPVPVSGYINDIVTEAESVEQAIEEIIIELPEKPNIREVTREL